MKLICGLGNPGKDFKETRHNLGFLVLDELRKKKNFPKFKLKKELSALVSQKNLKKEKIILLKPQLFMNQSGKAIKTALDFFCLKPEDLIVVHDDLDIPFGKIKISFSKGSAGHKGVESIISSLKTKSFIRFRIGIGQEKTHYPKNFVLEKFTKKEKEILKNVIETAIEAIELTLSQGKEKAMEKFNR